MARGRPQSPVSLDQAGIVGRALGDPAGFAPEPLSSHLRTASCASMADLLMLL